MKISIAGTGKIVEEVLSMLRHDFAETIEVTGIYAREHSVEHAIDLCMAYAPTGFVYTDYGRMLQEAEADFVYIANANHVHHEYAMQAMMAGKNVIFGIRPENIIEVKDGVQAPYSFSSKVNVYELLGAEVFLYFDLGSSNITARVEPTTKVRPGDTVKYTFDTEKIHVFDKETELTITN